MRKNTVSYSALIRTDLSQKLNSDLTLDLKTSINQMIQYEHNNDR
jgi:hypothetical protein